MEVCQCGGLARALGVTEQGAQLYQPVLHLFHIHTFVLLLYQCIPLLLQVGSFLPQDDQLLCTILQLGSGQILLALEIDAVVFQRTNVFPQLFEMAFRGQGPVGGETLPDLLTELGQNFLRGQSGQIPFQQRLSLVSQLLNKIEGVEDGEKHIPFAEQVVQIQLPHVAAIVGDGHAAVFSAAAEGVGLAGAVEKLHGHGHLGDIVTVEPVNTALPKEGEAGDRKGNGVGNAGFSATVAAGDGGGIAKGQRGGGSKGFEALQVQCSDLKSVDLFHPVLLMRRWRSQSCPADRRPQNPAAAASCGR